MGWASHVEDGQEVLQNGRVSSYSHSREEVMHLEATASGEESLAWAMEEEKSLEKPQSSREIRPHSFELFCGCKRSALSWSKDRKRPTLPHRRLLSRESPSEPFE